MGEHVANVSFRAHAQPQGAESQHVELHHGDDAVDENFDLTLTEWVALRGAAASGVRTGFEAVLTGTVAPPGGWTQDWKDAAWRAACRMWGP